MIDRPNNQSSKVFTIMMHDWQTSLTRLLDAAGLAAALPAGATVLIKPNLVEALEPPITTPVTLIDALVDYLQARVSGCTVLIGEGTGSIDYATSHCFDTLGYTEMAAAKGVELIDLNRAPLSRKADSTCRRWPEIFLPTLLDETYIISVPVLKAHTLAGVTLTMKNMMGCAPPSHYQQGGHWGKSSFHDGIDEAILDLNRYRAADFSLLDATVGMCQAHLWGAHCNPPVGRLAAAFDPVALDSYGTSLLGKRWDAIGHIRLAHQVLGTADPLDIHELTSEIS